MTREEARLIQDLVALAEDYEDSLKKFKRLQEDMKEIRRDYKPLLQEVDDILYPRGN